MYVMTGGEIPKTEELSGELYCSECKHTPPGASGVQGMSACSWERGAGAGMLPKEGVQGGICCSKFLSLASSQCQPSAVVAVGGCCLSCSGGSLFSCRPSVALHGCLEPRLEAVLALFARYPLKVG